MKPAASSNIGSASSAGTQPDEIPAVQILEAAQSQDRKETEDLLAGFDRPGRGPKHTSKERDFVDYYAKKKGDALDSGPGTPSSRARAREHAAQVGAPTIPRMKQGDVATVVTPRKRQGMPAWLGWGGAAALMMVFGGAVAYLATADGPSGSHVPTGPSAATTITAATPIPQATNDNVPPPDPSTATTATTAVTVVSPSAPGDVATPRASGGRRDPRAPSSAAASAATAAAAGAGATAPRATNATDDTKPPPRDDFIRDL
jgi:hypothetical protein